VLHSCLLFCSFHAASLKCSLERHDMPSGSMSVLFYNSSLFLSEAFHNFGIATEIAVKWRRVLGFRRAATSRCQMYLATDYKLNSIYLELSCLVITSEFMAPV
jgi:hypothetical protein